MAAGLEQVNEGQGKEMDRAHGGRRKVTRESCEVLSYRPELGFRKDFDVSMLVTMS